MNKALITPEGHYHIHSSARKPNTSSSEDPRNSWLKGALPPLFSNRWSACSY